MDELINGWKARIAIASLLLLSIGHLHAQRDKDSMLEDSLFAWNAMQPLKASAYPRSFSPGQLQLPQLFSQWLRKSYLPIGAIDNSFAIAEPNKSNEVQPYGVGICAEMWRPMWDNAGRKVVRQPHTANPVYILSNHIIDALPVPMLSTPVRSVFMRRSADVNKTFQISNAAPNFRTRLIQSLNIDQHAQIGKYNFQYFGCDGDGCQPLIAVYLTPGNRLPIRHLTRAEVIDYCEQAIPAETEMAKKKLKSTYGHRPESLQQEINRFNETVLPKWKLNVQKLREQNQNSLGQPAYISNANGIEMINIFNGDALFAPDDWVKKQNCYGLYTYEEGVLEQNRQNKTLWVCISWKPTSNDHMPFEREINRSMLNHFNFDYVYDYFFQPDKVKGVAYTIRNPEEQKKQLQDQASRKAAPINQTVLKEGVYFFDDFSTSTIGSQPRGWYMPASGNASTVARPSGQNQNWLQLGQYRVMPNAPKEKLPENFKMEFDVLCESFDAGTGPSFKLTLHNKQLTARGDYTDSPTPILVELDAKAGNAKFTQNPSGYTRLKATYKGMSSALRYADQLQYSNDFTNVNRKIHFTITKKGNSVKAYVNGKEIVALDRNGKPIPGFNELPAGSRLTSFFFENLKPAEKIFITNIEISQLK